MPIAFQTNGWTLFSWPYATPRHENYGANGWGFYSAGGQGANHYTTADEMRGEYNGAWFAAYLNTNGRWAVRGGRALVDVKLEAGKGYYYLHRGTGFTWRAQEP